jgi:glycine/D-amino acid oxidase-like deaminating enzyme
MLEHLNPTPQKPSRVVVLGAYGFVGGTCARLLVARGVPVLPLDKDAIDLMASGAAEQLQTRLAPDDAILVVSARAVQGHRHDGRLSARASTTSSISARTRSTATRLSR